MYITEEQAIATLRHPKNLANLFPVRKPCTIANCPHPVALAAGEQELCGPHAYQRDAEEELVKELMEMRAEAGKPVTEDQARKIIAFMRAMDAEANGETYIDDDYDDYNSLFARPVDPISEDAYNWEERDDWEVEPAPTPFDLAGYDYDGPVQ